MPDELPVICRSARHHGVFHQFGFSGHGFQLAPGVGALMAELIATGRSNLAIAPFDIARFSGEPLTPAPRSPTAPQVLG